MEQAFSWKFFERFTVAFLQFAIILVFVRFVAPNEMGIAIICLAIFHIINSVFVIGLSNILIQKDDVDELDYSTTLMSQLALATCFYIILYGSTDVIANWLQSDVIVVALRILGLTLFFHAVSSLYTAHMIRSINYSSLFSISVSSAFIAVIICVFLSIFRYGLYAVILWSFFYQLFSVLLLLLFYKWRPRIGFSSRRLFNILHGGWKQRGDSIVDVLFKNGQLIAIGYVFLPAALSFYVRGGRFPGVFVQQFIQVFHEKLLPTFKKIKHDTVTLQSKIREMVVLSAFVIFPFMTILFVTSEQLIFYLFGERWLLAVPFVQIFCVYYAFWPATSVFLQAITALDITEKYIKLDLLKKGILILLWVVSFPFGIKAVAVSMIVFMIISLFLNSFFLKKYINYSSVQVLIDLAPVFLVSSAMGVLIYLFHYILPSSVSLIVFQFVLGMLFYGTLAYFFKLQGWKFFIKVVSDEVYVRYQKHRILRKKSSSL